MKGASFDILTVIKSTQLVFITEQRYIFPIHSKIRDILWANKGIFTKHLPFRMSKYTHPSMLNVNHKGCTLNVNGIQFMTQKKVIILPYVVPMIWPKCKVPLLEHYIMKVSKRQQANILARAKSDYIRLYANFKNTQRGLDSTLGPSTLNGFRTN